MYNNIFIIKLIFKNCLFIFLKKNSEDNIDDGQIDKDIYEEICEEIDDDFIDDENSYEDYDRRSNRLAVKEPKSK